MLLGKESLCINRERVLLYFLDEDKSELEAAIKKGKRCSSSSLQLRVKNNNEKDILFWYVTIVPIMIEGQTFGSYVMVKDITRMKQQQEEINYLAFHDTVTEIGNRIFFQQELDRSIKRAQKHRISLGSCILI